MERTRSRLEGEIQNLEEEKNRVVEEAFIRAESEMKAVHENLAGVCAHVCVCVGLHVQRACERVSNPLFPCRRKGEFADSAACSEDAYM